MVKVGPQPLYDAEAMFLWWFNDGERRTLLATSQEFGCNYVTAKRYADAGDWDGRAEEIDAEMRRASAKRMGRMLAKARALEIDLIRLTEAVYARRLMPRLEDGTPNPDMMDPSEVGPRELAVLSKARELLMGGATERVVSEESEAHDLAAIEAEIAGLDEAALERGEHHNV